MKCLLQCRTLLTPSEFGRIWRFQRLHLASIRMSDKDTSKDKVAFNPQLLEILACPLSKKPLRYDKSNNELVCDDVGVAYPIVDGIPNLNPVDGRLLKGGQSQGLSDDHK